MLGSLRRSLLSPGRHSRSPAHLYQGSSALMSKLPRVTITLLLVHLGLAWGQVSQSGGAGHALLFANHAAVLNGFKGLDTDEFTFEAWISTSDFCHYSTIMSYSSNTSDSDPHVQKQQMNSFVIMKPWNINACHDFEHLTSAQDSCSEAYKYQWPASVVESNQAWHHLAVTWTAAANGSMRIFIDGLLMNTVVTGKTGRLQSGGSFMLGGEQDCVGGCTDRQQAFYGLLDEVRVWRVARTQQQIMANMRLAHISSDGLQDPDLVAYWQFNDPDKIPGVMYAHLIAKDASSFHNDLPLITPPSQQQQVLIVQGWATKTTAALQFSNSYALNENAKGMPTGDLTVSFWAKTAAFNASQPGMADETFFSYATHLPAATTETGSTGGTFADDAIRIFKYSHQYANTSTVDYKDIDTVGSISVDINANRDGSGQANDNHLSYAVRWVDDQWHHIAATWVQASGLTELYFDGVAQTPFLTASAGQYSSNEPARGGTTKVLAKGTARLDNGSLVLGQDQECFAGCFSPLYALDGAMADLRIWSSARSQEEVRGDMWSSHAAGDSLSSEWDFALMQTGALGKGEVQEANGKDAGSFLLWADAPKWEYSTAPLTDSDGSRVEGPEAGVGGHALALSDKQAVILNNFTDWPSTAITVEFWMQSTDRCRLGTPLSYATGNSAAADNTFLLFNYNDWGVSIMGQDEGRYHLSTSGVPATDGAWHHIAVTWQSSDGVVCLYDNGRKVWSVVRAAGMQMPPGGTLVIGREQDCMGGCFDSFRSTGAVGSVDRRVELGSQDFIGLIDELRIWSTVRTQAQIEQGMVSAMRRTGSPAAGLVPMSAITPDDSDYSNLIYPDLVAYWTFDEGQGFRARDVTNKGHDLTLTNTPQWQVVRWMAVCGDGSMEGPEKCDDGNTADGDGCSSACLVERSWHCSRTSPSICSHRTVEITNMIGDYVDGGPARAWLALHVSRSRGSGKGWIAVLVVAVVTTIAGLTAGLAYAYRSRLAGVKLRVPSVNWRRWPGLRGRYADSALDYLDPEEDLELAPEFVGATAPPQVRYQPLSGGNNQA